MKLGFGFDCLFYLLSLFNRYGSKKYAWMATKRICFFMRK